MCSERRVLLSRGGVGGRADGISVPFGADNLVLAKKGEEEGMTQDRKQERVIDMKLRHKDSSVRDLPPIVAIGV